MRVKQTLVGSMTKIRIKDWTNPKTISKTLCDTQHNLISITALWNNYSLYFLNSFYYSSQEKHLLLTDWQCVPATTSGALWPCCANINLCLKVLNQNSSSYCRQKKKSRTLHSALNNAWWTFTDELPTLQNCVAWDKLLGF